MAETYTYRVVRWQLSEFMTQHNVSQRALQRESGVALNTIKGMFRGETQRPDLEVLDRVIVALKVLAKRDVGVSDLLEHE